MPTLTLSRKSDDGSPAAPVQFTYAGATPDEPGPRGVLLRFLIAVAGNDIDAARALMTAKSQEAPRTGGAPDGDLEVSLGDSATDGDFTVIPAQTKGGGQEITLPAHLVQEGGAWRVDMLATLDKLMGGLMAAVGGMMEEAMGGIAEGVGKMMEGIGEATAGTFQTVSGTEPSSHALAASSYGMAGESDAHPIVQDWRGNLMGHTGLFPAVTVDWASFEAEARRAESEHGPVPETTEDLVRNILDELLEGLWAAVNSTPAFRDRMHAVSHFHFRRAPARAIAYEPEGRTVTFTTGANRVGSPDFYARHEVAEALAQVVPVTDQLS